MIAATQTPPAELATAVRAGRWEEVRTISSNLPAKLPPAVALAAAVAERQLGATDRALALIDAALPGAGALAPALRLEAAELAVLRGKDPAPYLSPLLARRVDATHRRAAAVVLRDSWESLPVRVLRNHRRLRLDRRLRRDLDAILAVRTSSRQGVDRLLRSDSRDRSAVRLARWVETLQQPTIDEVLMAAEALLANGWWREGEGLLARCPPPRTKEQRFRRAYLEARAAYRLGRYAEAATGYGKALAIAPGTEELSDVAVQLARIAELDGDWTLALDYWDRARKAAPREIEGWDGSTRLLAALNRPREAVGLARKAPSRIRRVFVPRLAATLLARGEADACREVLALVSSSDPAGRTVTVAAEVTAGRVAAARSRLAALLADRRAGSWRDLAVRLLPPSTGPPAPPPATTDTSQVAGIASSYGVEVARRAFHRGLEKTLEWGPLFTGDPLPEPRLAAPVAELLGVGLEEVAAHLFADDFPGATPLELAWSTRRLAGWGNRPAALSTGERLWRLLGEPPASLIPDALLPHLVPDTLTEGCTTAARAEGLEPSWLAAVVRRESRFAATVRSNAGAIGIAQIVPETARSLGAEPTDVLDPEIGLRLAAAELVRLRGVFQGRLAPVAAAYNAGGGVVAAWLNLLGEDANEVLFAAAAPYGQTARYVRAVVEGTQLFRSLDNPISPSAASGDESESTTMLQRR